MNNHSWVGSEKDFVDERDVRWINRVVVGCFGGNSSAGQTKNEDGCVIWQKEDWEFAAILDAHNSAESAELVIDTLKQHKEDFVGILEMKGHPNFKCLEVKLLEIFQSEQILNKCRRVKGETACLIVVRKANYVWWFSVGDCLVYALHPDLIALNQFQLNQRQFFEWIGQVNTFEQAVPCYTSGTRELRKGTNLIFLTTDGLVECPGAPFSDLSNLVATLSEKKLDEGISQLLMEIERRNVRDSTTIIAWNVEVDKEGSIPIDYIG
ncbi:protein phosphatase 2C domain-containing protein [Sporosarcina sp. E16_8]|uniref:protein phosphatase 2C domain-containing protein n=1 Tax=Sporosarcina sp. E16_8 TaxID=2789295 RepID=UPI001A928FB8|nr:protein phosphatase 2C domain-containing protein [Sporosarcina sp. E16_8]MBO0587655.1 protein phosphatase 2C domain-containing protein [Sporosarcina sp. E16_8]